ncbi:hypothetical protein SRABI106_04572 [Rahnella aquatilis]|nr:hypothetical protein SRABI106_04572 [Rahnella aquatilis]
MHADTFQREKADFFWLIGHRNIKDTHTGAPATLLRTLNRLADGAGVIDFFIGEADICEQITGVDHQQ